MIEKGGSFSYRERFDTAQAVCGPDRRRHGLAGVMERGSHPHPSPLPSRERGKNPHLNLPPKWGKKGITLPVRPSGFRPRIEYGAGSSTSSGQAPGPLPSRARHRERDKRAGFPTGANGCPPATSPTGGRTRGSAPTVGPASIPLIPSLTRPSRERGSDVSCLVVLSGWGLPGG